MHPWNLTPKEAIQLQKQLKDRVKTHLTLRHPQRIAGVDVAYLPEKKQSVATVVVVSCAETPFPYIPGLLSFREIPPILKALEQLSDLPDLILVDGHGQAHPRRFGIACHLGLWLKHPTIGIGKSRLCGEFRQPGNQKGASTDLTHKGEIIGKVLRTRTGVQPVFVSVGYGLPLKECVHWTLAMTSRFRLPEPIRRADKLCSQSKTH
jgi:deoxyribonuclease V